MARPIKKGLDYFPLDVDFLQDIKIRKILRACGSSSPTIIICILGYVYQDEGYFLYWDDDTRFLIAEDVDTTEELVDKVVQKSIDIKFFDQRMFTKFRILTSSGIQNRYKQASYKKANNAIEKDFDLMNVRKSDNGVSGVDNPVSDDGNPPAVVLPTTETRVSDDGKYTKESKVKESKVKNSNRETPAAENYLQITLKMYQETIGVLNPIIQQKIQYQIDDFMDKGSSEETANKIIQLAIEKSATNNVTKWNYVEGILKDWLKHNLLTLEDIQASENSFKRANSKQKPDEVATDWSKYEKETTTEDEAAAEQERIAKLEKLRGKASED
ncbi:Lin1244/Lin1753 domain-containing protein [Companilactobacillus mishanensis]|uniref:Lin1244/Lin1753 domain-containing protein n=1 Tax=Companilactobacillus mishanensis TaxID=2486008 RepID=UPI0012959713|nr:Lin1244/Lin1753 domain-containing protein [Companilactobacillus mishanensis]MQS88259.1 DUF4373 domain-containing protein [Companilactobacillus mishanensis]